MMHDMIESSGSPRPWRQYVRAEPLGEDASHAQDRVAVETPGKKQETNPAAPNRQIRKTPRISTVDPPGHRSTHRTLARRAHRTHPDERARQVFHGVIR
jgi:hypothetical protein